MNYILNYLSSLLQNNFNPNSIPIYGRALRDSLIHYLVKSTSTISVVEQLHSLQCDSPDWAPIFYEECILAWVPDIATNDLSPLAPSFVKGNRDMIMTAKYILCGH